MTVVKVCVCVTVVKVCACVTVVEMCVRVFGVVKSTSASWCVRIVCMRCFVVRSCAMYDTDL